MRSVLSRLLSRTATLPPLRAALLWLALFLPAIATIVTLNQPHGYLRPAVAGCSADDVAEAAPNCPEGTR